jgi:hypothetical protein
MDLKIIKGKINFSEGYDYKSTRLSREKKTKWQNIFEFGEDQVVKQGLSKDDIDEEIVKYRSEKKE